MKIALVSLLLAGSSLILAGGTNQYCKNDFDGTNQSICKKFDFSKVVPDDEQCGKNPKPRKYDGIKQTNCTTFYDIKRLPNQKISLRAANFAQLITNVFENGDTKMGYSFSTDIGDCRGFTCGYIGFTTGTNDAEVVVREYGKRVKKNPFAKYLPELAKLSSYPFGDYRKSFTNKLVGFDKVWKETTQKDPAFIQTQLDVGHAMYLKPALKYAASVGVKSNLGKAIFYDTIVQHGWQYVEPLINLPRIIQLTGPRKPKESEKSYLTRFLTTRRQLACCYPGKVWNDSSSRMYDLQNLVNDWKRNKDLKKPVKLVAFGVTVTGKETIIPKGSPKPKSLPIPQCPKKL
ncbi:unnamed protein product [Cunninghamella blakesleeana]